MADRYGADNVERALVMQQGSVLAAEVQRLRAELAGQVPAAGSWQTEALALRAELDQLRAHSPYYRCQCGREVYVSAVGAIGRVLALADRWEAGTSEHWAAAIEIRAAVEGR